MDLQYRRSSDDTTQAISKFWTLAPSQLKLRRAVKKRYAQPGGRITGDGQPDPRTIKQVRSKAAENDTSYLTELNKAANFLLDGSDEYYIEDLETSRRALVSLATHGDETPAGLNRRFGKETLSLDWLNSAWEDLVINEEETASGGIDDGEDIEVEVTGELSVKAIFEISPASVTVSQFTIQNLTNGAVLTVANTNFLIGSTFYINGVTGRFELETALGNLVESSDSLVDNTGFIPLDPGPNTLRYYSAFGPVNLKVQWRNRAYW